MSRGNWSSSLPSITSRAETVPAPDVLVGGTPCQAFSVAGLRASLDDDRGQLTLEYVRLLNAIDNNRPTGDECVSVWENVPGVLNTKDNAFGCFLGALAGEDCALEPAGRRWSNAGCVFGPQRAVAWRVLDAQYLGLAQRRKRVFVVSSARNGFDPCAVLFESEGLRWDTPPSRATREDATRGLSDGIKKWPADIACTLNAAFADKQGLENQHIDGGAPLFVPSFREGSFGAYTPGVGTIRASGGSSGGGSETLVVHGTQDPCVKIDIAHPLARNNGAENVVFVVQNATRGAGQNGLGIVENGPMYTLDTASQHGVATEGHARRLTEVECERLQGFPDNHTQIPYKNKAADDCPAGPRYRALGNSMAVPVMAWIGKRLKSELTK